MRIASLHAVPSFALASSAAQGMSPNLGWFLVAPAGIAAILLFFAWERGRTKSGVPPTPRRLFASYLLVLPAFAVGSCWAVAVLAAGKSQFHPTTFWIEACCGAVLFFVSCVYAWRSVAVGQTHAARGGVTAARMERSGRIAALGVVVTCALALAVMYLVAVA